MCGIAGIISHHPEKRNRALIEKMTNVLKHRGPDGEGFWSDETCVSFGHRRLAIIDLTPAGAQPMHYLNRYTIVFNGEIYNYKELKEDLLKQGYNFQSQSDTEVILAAYDCYKERCLTYFDGMFAFAIWDKQDKTLFAARDRFGEKPFYYVSNNDLFLFGSEMKALWAYGVDRSVDMRMLLNYVSLGYVQNPADKSQTFYSRIFSLPPAHYLLLETENYRLSINAYYHLDKQKTINISEHDALKILDDFLLSSVKIRLRSDVPTGTGLSGGLDSSTLSWYIKKAKGNQPADHKFFSATFPGFDKNEEPYVDMVSNALNLQSLTVTPTADDLIRDFERMMYHQEEPFQSSSIYAQYKVYELAAKNNTKVVLDGQGADEVFAGYHKYLHWYLQEIISRHRFFRFRKEYSSVVKNKIHIRWDIRNVFAAFLPSHVAIALEKAEYNRIHNNPYISKELMECTKGREWEGINKPIITKLNDILYFNTMRNGLEELLRFADRNSMSHGVEVRLPFLQSDLVEFIFSLQSNFKIQNGFTKYILRTLMQDRLPKEIVWRTDKVGYEPPQKLWMENPHLQEYMHESKKVLVDNGILKSSVLHKKVQPLDAHLPDNFDWRYLCTARLITS